MAGRLSEKGACMSRTHDGTWNRGHARPVYTMERESEEI